MPHPRIAEMEPKFLSGLALVLENDDALNSVARTCIKEGITSHAACAELDGEMLSLLLQAIRREAEVSIAQLQCLKGFLCRPAKGEVVVAADASQKLILATKALENATTPEAVGTPADSNDSDGMNDLRDCIIEGFANAGTLAAFMCALAATAYATPPAGHCYGGVWVDVELVIQWLSMSMFFLCIALCGLLTGDLQGVPSDKLEAHLCKNIWVYALPDLFTWSGLILLTLGYGIDLNERVGCGFDSFPLRFVAGPSFSVVIVFFGLYMRSQRRKLRRGKASLFAPWADNFEFSS